MEQSTAKQHSTLSKRIMRRVYLIWSIRLLLHPTMVKVLLAALLLVRSMKYVSYANVFANMPALFDVPAGVQFMRSALHHTQPMTIVLLSSVVWLSVWVIADALFRRREAWF